jgi:hypothetical protein
MPHEQEERFNTVFLDENNTVLGWACPWKMCKEGMELLEHTTTTSSFCANIASLISPCGQFWKARIVWCGENATPIRGSRETLYKRVSWEHELQELRVPVGGFGTRCPYLVNHTKKEVLNLHEILKTYTKESFDETLHPLPLLTMESGTLNDLVRSKTSCLPWPFLPNRPELTLLGSWARNSVSVERECPSGFTDKTNVFLSAMRTLNTQSAQS